MATSSNGTKAKLKPAIWVAVSCLLAIHFAVAFASITGKSITFDETAHIASGYLYWQLGDYRFNPESGNLVQRWATLPLAMDDLALGNVAAPGIEEGSAWAFGDWWLFESGRDAKWIVTRARVMIMLLSVCLGLVVFCWSRQLFGVRGAVFSLLLWAFSPTMLASGRLVTADTAAALFFALSTWMIWLCLHRITISRLLLLTFSVASLFLSKMSAPLILIVALLLVTIRVVLSKSAMRIQLASYRTSIRSRSRTALASVGIFLFVGLLTWTIVWSAYGFRYSASPSTTSGEQSQFIQDLQDVMPEQPLRRKVLTAIHDNRVLPEAYIWGMAYTLRSTDKRDTFLAGQNNQSGWWYFFPYTVAVKTPIPILITVVAAMLLVAHATFRYVTKHDRSLRLTTLYHIIPIFVLLGVYWAVSISSSLNIGHRHMLPVYGPAFVLAGCLFAARRDKQSKRFSVWDLLVVWLIVECALIFPHFLSYFNWTIGGPKHGYQHLVDSSIDWGQDLPRLADWVKAYRGSTEQPEPVYVAYFGRADPAYYDLEANWLHCYRPLRPAAQPPAKLQPGYYCISVTLLQTVYNKARGPWTEGYEELLREKEREVEDFRTLKTTKQGQQQLAGRRTAAQWVELFSDYEQLRTAKLCHYLRTHEPVERMGYSIHVYHLTGAQLAEAMGANGSTESAVSEVE